MEKLYRSERRVPYIYTSITNDDDMNVYYYNLTTIRLIYSFPTNIILFMENFSFTKKKKEKSEIKAQFF